MPRRHEVDIGDAPFLMLLLRSYFATATRYTISWSLKHPVATLAAYRTRMSTALRIVLQIEGALELDLRGRTRKRR